ncbi:hypothetical protein BC828DRAFT_387513 [Blastocladiella britannica]|nr:hypothetical protein BC828DRAFT_387513 [Blastocladiella britannica]
MYIITKVAAKRMVYDSLRTRLLEQQLAHQPLKAAAVPRTSTEQYLDPMNRLDMAVVHPPDFDGAVPPLSWFLGGTTDSMADQMEVDNEQASPLADLELVSGPHASVVHATADSVTVTVAAVVRNGAADTSMSNLSLRLGITGQHQHTRLSTHAHTTRQVLPGARVTLTAIATVHIDGALEEPIPTGGEQMPGYPLSVAVQQTAFPTTDEADDDLRPSPVRWITGGAHIRVPHPWWAAPMTAPLPTMNGSSAGVIEYRYPWRATLIVRPPSSAAWTSAADGERWADPESSALSVEQQRGVAVRVRPSAAKDTWLVTWEVAGGPAALVTAVRRALLFGGGNSDPSTQQQQQRRVAVLAVASAGWDAADDDDDDDGREDVDGGTTGRRHVISAAAAVAVAEAAAAAADQVESRHATTDKDDDDDDDDQKWWQRWDAATGAGMV